MHMVVPSERHRDDDPPGASMVAFATASLNLVANSLGHAARLVEDLFVDADQVGREAQALWNAARRHADALGHAARIVPRFLRVTGEAARLVALYRWHGATSGLRAAVQSPADEAAALAALHADGAERLYALCVDLRGGVLKLGQFASSRMDLLPTEYVVSLGRLQDRVPPVPAPAIHARIDEELGMTAAACFAELAAEPMAAASLAQVHAARLPDGRPVAVKVQVPGIEDIVEADLAALDFLTPALRDVLPLGDLDTMISEIDRALRAELDYEAEAANAAAFAACFAGDPDVIVPRVEPACSTRRVLTLEHIAGARLLDYLDGCEQRGEAGARDRDRLFAILLRTVCAQVLEHGLLHADPHPGNFLVVDGPEGPRLALLDFGCVQRYTPARRRAYAELGLAVLGGDAGQLARLFETLGFRSRDGDPDGLRAFAELMLSAFQPGRTLDAVALDAPAAFERVLRLVRENPIVAIPTDFVMLGRVFAVLGGLLLRYRPRLDLFQLLAPQLAAALRQPSPL